MSARAPRPEEDFFQPFRLEAVAASGRLVRLGSVVDAVLARHDYPAPVAMLLAETLALAALLAGAFKYDGVFTLQIKGEGPVRILVADVMSSGGMRGYAQFNATALAAASAAGAANGGARTPVARLLGSGYLAFTVDQGLTVDRYQGIVELTGATLADCIHHYFRQSEQLRAAVKVAVEGDAAAGWRAGAIMVQKLASAGAQPESGARMGADDEDDWRTAVALMGSSTSDELVDTARHPHALLWRLFNETGVRVFRPRALHVECRCNRAKVANTLRSFPRAEIEELKIDERVVVTCEFCGAKYDFDAPALAALYDT